MFGSTAKRPAVVRSQFPHLCRIGGAPRTDDRSWPRPRGDHHARANALNRHIARRRCDHGPGDETQFVSNRCVMLRAAELVGLLGAVGRSDRARRRPRQASPRGLPHGALTVGRHREDAALPLDEHIAHVGGGAGHERDAPVASARRPRAQRLAQHARLAEASACEEQPPAPLARGLQLLGAGVACPIVAGSGVEAREFIADLGEAREFRFSALWRLLRSQRRGVALRR